MQREDLKLARLRLEMALAELEATVQERHGIGGREVTKQETVETVKAEVQRLKHESFSADNPITRMACSMMSQKLQWALDLLTDCDEEKGN
jgi:hypothetical protein